MNMIKLLAAKANSQTSDCTTLNLENRIYHAFDVTGEYKDYYDLRTAPAEYMRNLIKFNKGHILVRSYFHKGELRLDWAFVKPNGTVSYGIEFDADLGAWESAIKPTNRKPWYWERKIAQLKRELPHWETDVQEAVNMRSECKTLLAELETNFNINNNYYRIQNNAAHEAHSIIVTCDMLVDNFEREMESMQNAYDSE